MDTPGSPLVLGRAVRRTTTPGQTYSYWKVEFRPAGRARWELDRPRARRLPPDRDPAVVSTRPSAFPWSRTRSSAAWPAPRRPRRPPCRHPCWSVTAKSVSGDDGCLGVLRAPCRVPQLVVQCPYPGRAHWPSGDRTAAGRSQCLGRGWPPTVAVPPGGRPRTSSLTGDLAVETRDRRAAERGAPRGRRRPGSLAPRSAVGRGAADRRRPGRGGAGWPEHMRRLDDDSPQGLGGKTAGPQSGTWPEGRPPQRRTSEGRAWQAAAPPRR